MSGAQGVFSLSTARDQARQPVSRDWAHMADVIWRYFSSNSELPNDSDPTRRWRLRRADSDGLVCTSQAYEGFQRGVLRHKDHTGRQVQPIADAVSYQQPPVPGGRHAISQRQSPSVIPASPLAAIASSPPRTSLGRRSRLDRPLPRSQAERCCARNSQHIGLRLDFEPYMQELIVAARPGGNVDLAISFSGLVD
jgi:hypothetical protein